MSMSNEGVSVKYKGGEARLGRASAASSAPPTPLAPPSPAWGKEGGEYVLGGRCGGARRGGWPGLGALRAATLFAADF